MTSHAQATSRGTSRGMRAYDATTRRRRYALAERRRLQRFMLAAERDCAERGNPVPDGMR